MTGRIVHVPEAPHPCKPGTTRPPRLLPVGGYSAKPAPVPGTEWQCDSCQDIWTWTVEEVHGQTVSGWKRGLPYPGLTEAGYRKTPVWFWFVLGFCMIGIVGGLVFIGTR